MRRDYLTPPSFRLGGRPIVGAVCLALVLSVVFATLGLTAEVRAHHFEGQVALWVSEIAIEGGPAGVVVTAVLVERDVGTPVSGFGVTISAIRDDGRVIGPVECEEEGLGTYRGILALTPGTWDVLVTGHQGPSSLSALGSSHRQTVQVDVDGTVMVVGEDDGGAGFLWAIVAPIVAIVALLVVLRWRKGSRGSTADDTEVEVLNEGDTSDTSTLDV